MKDVYALLNHIQTNLDAPKSQYNQSFDFHYRNAEDILVGVLKLIGDGTITINDEPTEFAGLILMKCTVKLRLNDKSVENSAYVEIPPTLQRMSAPQKWTAISSYCRKMALTGLFACNDDKDLDTLNVKQESKSNYNNNNYNYNNKNLSDSPPPTPKIPASTELAQLLKTYTSQFKDTDAVNELINLFKVSSLKDLCKRNDFAVKEAISVLKQKLTGKKNEIK